MHHLRSVQKFPPEKLSFLVSRVQEAIAARSPRAHKPEEVAPRFTWRSFMALALLKAAMPRVLRSHWQFRGRHGRRTSPWDKNIGKMRELVETNLANPESCLFSVFKGTEQAIQCL